MRRSAWVSLAAVLGACASTLPQPAVAPARGSLPPLAEQAYRALDERFDRAAAMDVVAFMQQYWRIAGNPGFNASIDHVRGRLERAGLPVVRVEEFPSATPGWDYERGSLWIEGESEPVLSKERDGVSLAIHSFSTPEGGLTARLVDVGRGEPADFNGRDVTGAVVMGNAGLGALWREAVRARGAAGVISTAIAPYVRPDDPRLMDEAHKDVLQWGSVPYDEARAPSVSRPAGASPGGCAPRSRATPTTRVRVEVASRFHRGPTRTLVAEIPGSVRSDERIVMVAHLQEPGANDNASGSATLYALARALQEAIAQGAIAPPARTLTFLWLDEMRGSREWMRAHPEEAAKVQYMFSLDMTGEDTSRDRRHVPDREAG